MARKIDPDKRQRILQAARETFNEFGVEKAPISLIAKRANIATGTVYLYFKSKEDIVEGLVDLYMTKSAERLIHALSNPDMAMAIKDAVHESLKHASEERDLLRLIDAYRSSGRKMPTKGDETGLEAVECFIKRAVKNGASFQYNRRIIAEMIGGMIEWIAKLCFIYKVVDIQRYEETLVSFLQQALLKDVRKQT